MKSLLLLSVAVLAGCASASAQYFASGKGTVLTSSGTRIEEKKSMTSVCTVVESDTGADGVVTVRLKDVQSSPEDGFGSITSFSTCSFNPADTVTTIVMQTAEDFQEMMCDILKKSAESQGQYVSESDMNELRKKMVTKGEIVVKLSPNMAAGTKLPKQTLRMDLGENRMTMNLWEGKVLGKESVEVPAGKYDDCLKISYVLRRTSPGGVEKENITEWYAKGVGVVKQIATDKKGKVLVEQVLESVKNAD